MEPKYVSLNDIANEVAKRQMVDPKVGLFNWMPFVYPEYTPDNIMHPIITEDIECEIVEPKQLPPAQ